jgi:paraquat-inducible protein B
MEASVEHVITKLDKMPINEIAQSLQKTMGDLDLTLLSARGTLDNASTVVGPNSAQTQQLDSTLEEVRRAARSVRVLADYLDRHPEALIRGKKGEAK